MLTKISNVLISLSLNKWKRVVDKLFKSHETDFLQKMPNQQIYWVQTL